MMKKVSFKLQNLIFREKYGLDEHWWLEYRSSMGSKMLYDNVNSCHLLDEEETIECFTYLNSITIRKWKKYTNIADITLNIKVQGNFTLQLFGHYRDGDTIQKEWIKEQDFTCPTAREVSITFPEDLMSEVCGFYLIAKSDVRIYSGYYSTFVEPQNIKNTHISIATTTFKKEMYIEQNIKLLEKELFYSGELAGKHITMRVIDNGRTLDVDKYNSEYIQIYPNQNVGGAGGFTRGMLESMNSKDIPSHVLLMDDDVKILPESLIRTYSLLALLKDEFDTYFISGAMLYMEHMNIQHEDVGYVRPDGSFGPRKPGMDLAMWDQVLLNEEEYAPLQNSYAGWWYCCIPTKTIDMENLPIPLFIRGDDVEYSVKQNAKFITLNGICIWHKGFVNKYNAALELYLVHRNSLITQAMSGIYQNIDFMKRIDKFFWKELNRLSYQSCELLLDAIEHYLNGPKFMMTPQGERIMKEQGAKNEPMIELQCFSDLKLNLNTVSEGLYEEAKLKGLKKFIYNVTKNGHILPKLFLKKEAVVIPYDWFETPKKQYLCSKLLAVNSVDKTAYLRVRSKVRYKELVKRRNRLFRIYRKNKKGIEQQYRDAAKILKSREFWVNYLEMN